MDETTDRDVAETETLFETVSDEVLETAAQRAGVPTGGKTSVYPDWYCC